MLRGFDWDSIAAGGQHSMGIKTSGTLWAWGYDGSGSSYGQLGLVMLQ